jgi:methyl-accepting chemotaxis protein
MRREQTRLLQVDQPAAAAARGVREGLHQTAAGLRGSIASGGEQFRHQREQGQQAVQQNLQSLDKLAGHLTAEERQTLDQVRRELGDIEALQRAMENAPRQTTAEPPAFQKLAGDSTPLGERMLAAASAMIEIESKLEKTPQRVKLLEEMTSLRAALHGSLVEMHSYLTTAQEQHIAKFGEQWRGFSARLGALANNRRMLTSEQGRQLGQMQQLVSQFRPLPDRLFALRKSESWTVAQQPLRDDAAPREAQAGALLAQVIHRTEERAQQATQSLQAQSASLGIFAVGGPGAAAIVGLLIGLAATRRVSRRLRQTTKALEAVAAGDRTARLPVETSDEFGRMASAINRLAETSIEQSLTAATPTVQVDLGRFHSFVDAEITRRRPHTRLQAAPVHGAQQTAGATQPRSELAQQTENIASSSESLRNQAQQLDQLMRRLQEGLAQLPLAQAEATGSGETAQSNIHSAESPLAGPKVPMTVKQSSFQTA